MGVARDDGNCHVPSDGGDPRIVDRYPRPRGRWYRGSRIPLRLDGLELLFDQAADAGRFIPEIGQAAEPLHPWRIRCLRALAFMLELSAEGLGDELPQTDTGERRPSFREPKKIVGYVDAKSYRN